MRDGTRHSAGGRDLRDLTFVRALPRWGRDCDLAPGGVCGAPGALLSALLSAPAQSLRDRSPAAGTELSLTPPSMSSVSVSSQVSERDGGTGAAVRLIYKVFEFMT